jgi:hypothetical protein
MAVGGFSETVGVVDAGRGFRGDWVRHEGWASKGWKGREEEKEEGGRIDEFPR